MTKRPTFSVGRWYRPELDGLRAVAIGLVLVGHAAGIDSLAHAGVGAFFVLSGFLITQLVEPGGLRAFYLRRVARLAPALLSVVAFVLVAFGPTGVLASLSYLSNWIMAAGGDLGPLQPTWSLAVEEQFYLLWPLALVLWPRHSQRIAIGVIVVGAILWLVLPWRVAYLSTPTNAAVIMVGALIALRSVTIPARYGYLGLALILLGGSADAVLATAVGAGIVIASGVGVLSPLAPIGRRAYGLYLWHWPLTVLFGPPGLALTFVVAEISYRWLETPIRQWARSRSEPHDPEAVARVGGVGARQPQDPQLA